jgi:hypothetical protein
MKTAVGPGLSTAEARGHKYQGSIAETALPWVDSATIESAARSYSAVWQTASFSFWNVTTSVVTPFHTSSEVVAGAPNQVMNTRS